MWVRYRKLEEQGDSVCQVWNESKTSNRKYEETEFKTGWNGKGKTEKKIQKNIRNMRKKLFSKKRFRSIFKKKTTIISVLEIYTSFPNLLKNKIKQKQLNKRSLIIQVMLILVTNLLTFLLQQILKFKKFLKLYLFKIDHTLIYY